MTRVNLAAICEPNPGLTCPLGSGARADALRAKAGAYPR